MNAIAKKNTGSYYTSHPIAEYIAEWAIKSSETRVLEPSFGNGIFIDSAISRFSELGNSNPNIVGIEIQPGPYNLCMKSHSNIIGFQMDFMDYKESGDIDAIIGNPPYISLKNLPENEKEKSLKLVRSHGIAMQTSGSLWMPFVIHATELLKHNGKLGFVLPYEITYVRYAHDLWRFLSENYGKITICRIYHDFFPDVDVETVILLAADKGTSTNRVCYKVFATITDLYEDNACHTSQIYINDIICAKKPFERELMPESVIATLNSLRKNNKLGKLIHDCKFKIGYVSGNKSYFHISDDDIQQYGIQSINVRKCLTNAKQISANEHAGIETRLISDYSHLFYPIEVGAGEKKYIDHGLSQSVNAGYKCRVRNPWYLIPGMEIPDMVLTVFGNVPKLLLNNGQFFISNSLLGGFSKSKNQKELICRWYNSLTLLSIETTIHSLGGGTLVLIPGETDRLEIISNFPANKVDTTYNKLSDFARHNSTEEIYKYGDHIVLKEIYGFSDNTIREINRTISILRNWRNPEKRRG